MEDQRSGPQPPSGTPEAAPAPAASEAEVRQERLSAARAAAEAEARTEAPTGPAPAAPGESPRSDEPTADAPPDGPPPDDDEPNPSVPKLTRGETRKLMEQWEAERRPRFFKDLEAAQTEAQRLKDEAASSERAEAEARAGYEQWYGPDAEYARGQVLYDQIVGRISRGEYVPDAEVQAAQQFQRWRENRTLAGAVNQRELQKVLANVDGYFRAAKVDGVDVPAVLAEVSARRGTPADVLAEVAKRARSLAEGEWKGKYEAEKEAHQATRQRFGLGRAVSGVSGGRPPARGDLVAAAMNGSASDRDALIERAKRGEFAGLDLSDR